MAKYNEREHYESITPDPTLATRGKEAREARRKHLKKRLTIRLDQDVVDTFKSLTPGGKGYQGLINQALREWLSARSIESLIQKKLEGGWDEHPTSPLDLDAVQTSPGDSVTTDPDTQLSYPA